MYHVVYCASQLQVIFNEDLFIFIQISLFAMHNHGQHEYQHHFHDVELCFGPSHGTIHSLMF